VTAAILAEEASRFAGALARAAAGALGDSVAAVILHGSLTLGDYLPGRSDVDLLAVVDRPLDGPRLDALTGAVAAARPPARVDLRVVTRQVAAAPTPAPPMEAYLELTPGSGVQVERRHPGERDLVVEFSVCRAHGRRLVGAPPAGLIGEVPPARGRCGAIQPCRWCVTPCGSATTRPGRSTRRRCSGSWQRRERGWPAPPVRRTARGARGRRGSGR
jgi:hypothetical protein